MARTLVHWIVALTVSAVMMGFVLAGAAKAQEAVGDWHGAVATPTGSVRVGLSIARDATGALSGPILRQGLSRH
jgi:hypothetical protein